MVEGIGFVIVLRLISHRPQEEVRLNVGAFQSEQGLGPVYSTVSQSRRPAEDSGTRKARSPSIWPSSLSSVYYHAIYYSRCN